MIRPNSRGILFCCGMLIVALASATPNTPAAAPATERPADLARSTVEVAIRPVGDHATASVSPSPLPFTELPLELHGRGTGFMSAERAAPPAIRHSDPQSEPSGRFTLFGMGAPPNSPGKHATLSEPNVYAQELGNPPADRDGTLEIHQRSAKAYGDEVAIPLDTVMPAMQTVVGWLRSHRGVVLTSALVVLLLTWAATHWGSRCRGSAVNKGPVPPTHHRRRHRSSSHRHSGRPSAASDGSSSSPGRRLSAALGATGTGRSSGRHR